MESRTQHVEKVSPDLICSRRQVLQIMALSALSPPRGMPTERNIRWALGAVTWVVKAEPGSPRWEDILADVAAGGFEGFEPFTTPTLPVNDENMATLEGLAAKYKVRMSGIYWGDDFHLADQHDRLVKDSRRFLGYLRRFGAERLIIGPPEPNVENEKQAIGNMAKVMNSIGKLALDEYRIKVGVHPHVAGLIENPRQIDQLMEETDPRYFYFAPDTAQIWMGGGDPVRVIEKYKQRVVYLHYKDIRAYHRGLNSYLDNVIELGRGVIDFPALHRILKSVNYKGWITIDLDNARISPLESAKVNRAYIDKVLTPIYS
jgi:inosose dehydratase